MLSPSHTTRTMLRPIKFWASEAAALCGLNPYRPLYGELPKLLVRCFPETQRTLENQGWRDEQDKLDKLVRQTKSQPVLDMARDKASMKHADAAALQKLETKIMRDLGDAAAQAQAEGEEPVTKQGRVLLYATCI